jgi:signal transduction histidine kinase
MDLANRLAFLQLDDTDIAQLHSLAPLFLTYENDFVEKFYRHLFSFPATASFLQDPALVERLKESQRQHFASMLEAVWDEAYVQRRHQVGDTHADVGIEPDVFLGAYNLYVQYCFQHLMPELSERDQANLNRLLSVLKVIFLDIGLTLDAYFARSIDSQRQALDMLWKANVELKQFAQLASHDLKTPLATVANLCDEALDEFGTQMPEGARDLVEAARQRTFRMSRMIDELLAFSAAPEGVETNTEISSQEALSEALDRLQPLIQEKQVELSVSDKLPEVLGNKVRLREAFYNLLSNAVKFLNKRPGRISVAAEVRGHECVFCISDNGPGIPPDELQRIFVPFRRLSVHHDVPGSGLGLYFTKNMIEHQAGRIWVESEPGEGSRFYMLLKRSLVS